MRLDKNTIIGFVLIFLILAGFQWYDQKTRKENQIEYAKNQVIKAKEDSLRLIAENLEAQKLEEKLQQEISDSTNVLFAARQVNDGVSVIENDLLKLSISNKGAQIVRAELKDSTYKSNDIKGRKGIKKGDNIVLFEQGDAEMNIMLNGKEHNIKTSEFYFQKVEAQSNDSCLRMRLPVANGNIYMTYSLVPGSYLLKMSIQAEGLEGFFPVNTKEMEIVWNEHVPQQEKGFSFENSHSSISFRTTDGETDVLSSMGADEVLDDFDEDEENLKWIAFKSQFFSQIFIADDAVVVSKLSSKQDKEGSGYLKTYNAEMKAKFDPTGVTTTDFAWYIGPNKFSTLKENEKILASSDDLDLQSMVYLGWPIVRWINRFFTVYLFDFLTGWGINMGIVLLLLTILVKLIVYPLQRKSYISSANMRVLRPKVDEINKKYPKPEDAMMKQQEMMQLYSQYGVSPMGGCLPMLIQMPVWIALFNFIPNAIELRGQSFLWADDLSTYDDIINWGTDLWLIGDHISLFCVLWCVSTFGNTWISMRQQKDTMMPEQQQAMGMMKWFSYLMPVIFFFSFNGYSAGLNYYYFLSGLIGILMMWYLKKTTDDKKLLQKLEERYARKKANPKKSSSMMEKLQALQERQQEILRQQEAARNYNKEENKRYNK